MPELPEVETIRRGLLPRLKGQVITDVSIEWHKTFDADAEYIATHVVGAVVTDIDRRGKVLIMHLNNNQALLFHLKMTGQMILEQNNESRSKNKAKPQRFGGGHPTKSMEGTLPDTSTRVIFTFDSGDKLFFNDQRKFGWIKLLESSKVESEKLLASMGPEPLTAEFGIKNFELSLRKRNSPIKAVLLDQSTLAGMGNIYVDEALHLAKIHPSTVAAKLKRPQVIKLFEAIKKVLNMSVERGGTSFSNYVNALGVRGDYLQHARAFRREGQACPECQTEIIKIRVAGRGTHVCPKCQRAPKSTIKSSK